MDQIFTLYLKLLFMMTPFFVLSVFITMTKHLSGTEKRSVILKFGIAISVASLMFLLFGKYIFSLFGITLDAFKIGAGSVLFLSALDMIRGDAELPDARVKQGTDFAIVPLAVPVTIGPGMIGILMVMGAEIGDALDFFQMVTSLAGAVITLVGILLMSDRLNRIIGRQGLQILPKIIGLFVSAIAAQIVFSGVQGFLGSS